MSRDVCCRHDIRDRQDISEHESNETVRRCESFVVLVCKCTGGDRNVTVRNLKRTSFSVSQWQLPTFSTSVFLLPVIWQSHFTWFMGARHAKSISLWNFSFRIFLFFFILLFSEKFRWSWHVRLVPSFFRHRRNRCVIYILNMSNQ